MENSGALDEDVAQALELSEAVPKGMNFFSIEELTENADGNQGAGSGKLSHRHSRSGWGIFISLSSNCRSRRWRQGAISDVLVWSPVCVFSVATSRLSRGYRRTV